MHLWASHILAIMAVVQGRGVRSPTLVVRVLPSPMGRVGQMHTPAAKQQQAGPRPSRDPLRCRLGQSHGSLCQLRSPAHTKICPPSISNHSSAPPPSRSIPLDMRFPRLGRHRRWRNPRRRSRTMCHRALLLSRCARVIDFVVNEASVSPYVFQVCVVIYACSCVCE